MTDDRKFYIIRSKYDGGFFWNFAIVLSNLFYAYKHDMIPIVDLETKPTSYTEPEPVHGTRNCWEYYFEPVSSYSLQDVIRSAPREWIVYSDGDFHYKECPAAYGARRPTSKLVEAFRPVINKYIRLKPHIREEHAANMQPYKGHDILGVHYRGTDITDEFTPPPLSKWLDNTQAEFDSGKYDYLFLATDEQAAIDAFSSAFGDRLIYNDSQRQSQGVRVGVHHDRARFTKGNRYQLGKEVLLDALTLSMCKSLYCSQSNIAMSAIMLNGNRYDKIIMAHSKMTPRTVK